MNHLPLKGVKVLEFSQYLSGPSAGLRLADLGARVIKIERPKGGDACRQLAIKNLWADDSSLLFHTINRNKESFAADLKNPEDLAWVKRLIAEADVVTHNFRPGVMEKAGLDYASVSALNPKIIYAEITGYGKEGPWKGKPGQDLLLQSLSGLVYTSGNEEDNPVPFGIAIADILCGAHLVQGILAALIRRHKKGVGALIEVSLLESLLDFQFELLTTYYTSGQPPQRSQVSNGHSLLSAPYGIYETADGYLAIAMTPLAKLAAAIDCPPLYRFEQEEAFRNRDEIKAILVRFLKNKSTAAWLAALQQNDIWAMPVLNWKELQELEAYRVLQMEQEITLAGKTITTTRCPIRINGERLFSSKKAPGLGEHTQHIKAELLNAVQ
ncbi:CoA transferase [Flavisolibacter sp. BT320]|nr:CoA transferase [Flavisolibacter longurius]